MQKPLTRWKRGEDSCVILNINLLPIKDLPKQFNSLLNLKMSPQAWYFSCLSFTSSSFFGISFFSHVLCRDAKDHYTLIFQIDYYTHHWSRNKTQLVSPTCSQTVKQTNHVSKNEHPTKGESGYPCLVPDFSFILLFLSDFGIKTILALWNKFLCSVPSLFILWNKWRMGMSSF